MQIEFCGGGSVELSAREGTPAAVSLAVVGEVWAERLRQMTSEGFYPAGDVGRCEDLGLAASAYCYAAGLRHDLRGWVLPGKPPRPPAGSFVADVLRALWPWDFAWWKPTDRRRDLVKGAALALAAIEAFDAEQRRQQTGL